MPCPHCPLRACCRDFSLLYYLPSNSSVLENLLHLCSFFYTTTTSLIELPARWLEAMTHLMSCFIPQRWRRHHVNNSRCHAWSAFIVVTSPVRYLDLCHLLRWSTRKIQADLSILMNSDSCFATSMFISISAITTGAVLLLTIHWGTAGPSVTLSIC